MRRFFVDPSAIKDATATLTGEEVVHARNVLRLTPGDSIILFDGLGHIYDATITEIDKKNIVASILQKKTVSEQAPLLHMGIGLLKGTKMDLIIQKATELGIHTLLPFTSEHGVVRNRSENRLDRWQRISLEACKQCGRPIPLHCGAITDFANLLSKSQSYGTRIIFWEEETSTSLREIILQPSSLSNVLILIGPEGGFSKPEVMAARQAGFISTSLGNRTLRAETAALAAMAIMQFLLGNLNLPS